MGEVARLFIAAARHGAMLEQFQVPAIADFGLKGCAHGRTASRRQVLLIEFETLEEFGLLPGSVRENITTKGIRLAQLRMGQRLRVGEAVLEVAVPCEPCDQLEAIRPGLRDLMLGRRGILCRVMQGGLIRRGDALQIVAAAAALAKQSQRKLAVVGGLKAAKGANSTEGS